MQQRKLKHLKTTTMEMCIFLFTRVILLACLAVLIYMMMPNYAEQNNDGWE